MIMSPKDYTIIRHENDCIYVLSDMLSYGMEWPPTIHNTLINQTFRFVSNEAMEPWMASCGHGYARYQRIPKEVDTVLG